MEQKTLQQLRAVRIEKLNKLREMGINPYPSKTPAFESTSTAKLKKPDEQVAIVGRIMAMRGHGKIFFMDLFDGEDKLQCFFEENTLHDKIKLIELFDIGDFLHVNGTLFLTQAGELTIRVESFTLLSKSIRPLPDKWHGLKDIEERYRKRYLDTILNQEAKQKLLIRSKVIDAIRDFLTDRSFIEVETPTLQPVYGGGFARPFKTHHNALDTDFYLRISDEMYLKRMIVGGFKKVFEITKVFRNEGVDLYHNPEFTMFEAQIAFEDYTYGMDIIEEIFEYVALRVINSTEFVYQGQKMSVKRPWARLKLVEAVKKYSGIDPLSWKTVEEAKESIKRMDIPEKVLGQLNTMRSIGECMAFAFEEIAEEKLIQPTIIYDYPVEVSPLAKKCDDPRFTQRFEMFAFGSELGNNYTELSDPLDLNQRFIEEKNREKAGFEEAHQTDYDYLEAIEHGFPPTCGIAIGIDRFVMFLTDTRSIKEIIPFPTLRPESTTKAEKYDYGAKKIIAVISGELPLGQAMNALGHLTFSAGHNSDESWMGQKLLIDADGNAHVGISKYPVIVLKANKSEIKDVVKKAKEKGILAVDYPQEMFDTGKDEDLVKAVSKAKESSTIYHAVVLVGNSEELKTLTSHLSLYK